MRITPSDIPSKKFNKSFWGYVPGEVDQWLNEIVICYEEDVSELKELRQEITRLRNENKQLRGIVREMDQLDESRVSSEC
ncbi:DivIVA domain-containing protein [Thermoactinomyces sp. DSM 45891]|uniref:DivIVA domain-containing protein n=1 Tax=Thermoactinomyces sp. DSM 45891 TaxID=1761907 RepID=UPI000923E9D2|nr:DivIVA domain-containing protein [Thermoactinomyces sp. DSM 45891]SFX06873.1 DivIVA domain-containing protein [Thermoactinomyces sp. DSM 45891]